MKWKPEKPVESLNSPAKFGAWLQPRSTLSLHFHKTRRSMCHSAERAEDCLQEWKMHLHAHSHAQSHACTIKGGPYLEYQHSRNWIHQSSRLVWSVCVVLCVRAHVKCKSRRERGSRWKKRGKNVHYFQMCELHVALFMWADSSENKWWKFTAWS